MKKREERDREYTLLYPRVDLLVMALLLGDPLPEMDTSTKQSNHGGGGGEGPPPPPPGKNEGRRGF